MKKNTTYYVKFSKQSRLLSSCIESIILCNQNYAVKPRIRTHEKDFSLSVDVARSNWLITELSKEGKLNDARKLFDEMSERDVVTWATVISGYIRCGLIEEARRLFNRVDSIKNVVSWTAMLSGYVRSGRVKEAERLFDAMPEKNVVSCNTMIDGYMKNREIDKGLKLFEKMPERNVVSWNTVITALGQSGRIEEAKRLFDKMPNRDVISWTAMVAGLARNGKIDDAREIFDKMPERNVVSWNVMITGYAQNKRINEAFELFERMPKRDSPSWNMKIMGVIQNRDLKKAREFFYAMPKKVVISWTTMITGYIQEGESEDALRIFSQMMSAESVKPNEGTFVSVLSACSDLAGLSEGRQIHQIISKTIYHDTAFIISALINMYSKCGELTTARKLFDDKKLISRRDLVAWNGMRAAYARHGHGKEAITLYNEMKRSGFKPNDVTCIGLLSASSHTGLLDEGLKIFNKLTRDNSIKLRDDHYACLVDLCGRAGKLKEAYNFIEQLGVNSSLTVWEALVAGCNVHRDVETGKLAAKKLLEAEPDNAGTYLLLLNIYASAGKWKEAAKVRSDMKDEGLKKQPGCSWIEVNDKVKTCRNYNSALRTR